MSLTGDSLNSSPLCSSNSNISKGLEMKREDSCARTFKISRINPIFGICLALDSDFSLLACKSSFFHYLFTVHHFFLFSTVTGLTFSFLEFSVIYWIRNNFPILCYVLSFHIHSASRRFTFKSL